MEFSHHFKKDILIVIIVEDNIGHICKNFDVFIDEIFKLINFSTKIIAFDMSKMSFLNSTGLSELIRVKDKLFDNDIELILINPLSRVRSLLEMIGVDDFFSIIENEDELDRV